MTGTGAIDTTLLWMKALGFLAAEDLPGSESACDEILVREPDHADALHMKGVIAFRRDDRETGLSYFGRSVQAEPDRFGFRLNLARIHLARGEWTSALAHLERAVELDPSSFEATQDLATASLEAGETEAAIDVLHRALRLSLNHPHTWLALGRALLEEGRIEEAIFALESCLRLEDDDPATTLAWFHLGRARGKSKDLEGARVAFEEVVKQRPESVEALHNLGDVLLRLGRLEEAYARFQAVLALDPDQIPSLLEMATVIRLGGDFERSLVLCENAHRIDPSHVEARIALGMMCLTRGDFARGWPLYETRREDRKHRDSTAPFRKRPEWQGGSLVGKRILVYPEQGYGDILQFARYLPLLQGRGAEVLFQPPHALQALFRDNDLGVTILPIEEDAASLDFDYFVPLGTLPLRFGTDLGTIPSPERYLEADPRRIAAAGERLRDHGDRLLVGIVWQGNPEHRLDSLRSIPLATFTSLLELENVAVFSLQVGPGIEQIGELSSELRPVDLGSGFKDFTDTAATLASLDLVVTVDTATAHLAGALGVPAWILLPTVADWRWLEGRVDSPWYRSVRLYRQGRRGEWGPVIEQVVKDVGDHRVPRSRLRSERRQERRERVACAVQGGKASC